MAKKKKKNKEVPRNRYVRAMMECHPRKQVIRQGPRRPKDARNHWSNQLDE